MKWIAAAKLQNENVYILILEIDCECHRNALIYLHWKDLIVISKPPNLMLSPYLR